MITDLLKQDYIQKILLVAIIGLLILFLFNQCESNKEMKWFAEQNQNALTDTLTKLNDRLGNAVWEKYAFAGELDDIKKLNAELYKEAIELKGTVKTLHKLNADLIISEIRKIKIDPPDIKETDSNYFYTYNWNENYKLGSFDSKLSGIIEILKDKQTKEFELKNIEIKKQAISLGLKTFITEDDDGLLKAGVAPLEPTPGLTFKLETGVFDPALSSKYNNIKKNDFSVGFGPYIGIGYGQIWNPSGNPPTYNGVGWSSGLSINISYKIFEF